jgi:transcriptional regulator with XRE-family HTH domain
VDTVKEIRRRKGWSQKDLAEESGVGQDTISGIESGRHEPRPSTLRKLADALDVEVADFFREPAVPLAEAPREAGPLSFSRWLEERFGHSYLALAEEEIEDLFEGLSGREDEEERKRELFSAIHLEYLATTKTRNLPAEERVLVRGHHKEGTSKWLLAQKASGQAGRITEEFERSIKEALEAATGSETA